MPMNFRTLLTVLLLAAACATVAISQQQPIEKRPRHLTVMAYNVNNMYDVFDDPYTNDEGTRVKPRREYEQIANLIEKVDADVIALSEVENEGVLKAMVYEVMPDAGYDYIAVMPTNSTRGGNLGVVSRLPIVSMTSHRLVNLAPAGVEPFTFRRFARDLLRVRLAVTPNNTLDLYVVHFKSKRNYGTDIESRKWRLAEAITTRRIIDQHRRTGADWVLIAGDLNDTPSSPPVTALLSPRDDAPPPLLDLHAQLPPEKRITYLSRKYRSTIDYLLASPQLAECLVPGSSHVPDDPQLLAGSDHAPVVATFSLPWH